MKTRENSFLSIKSKLTAAVAMLLVAFFMVISSSYAWFTLSTAPEVTGIYTAVGANGNLEIALLNGTTYADPTTIGSNVGDSMTATNDVTRSNLTWGNLIDLDHDDYGLEQISLLPSRLTASATSDGNGYILGTNFLSVPVYGADGRVESLNASKAITGTYNGTSFVNGGNGVRAIGTTTSMTQQQLDYNTAVNTISRNLTAAKTAATRSLQENGPALAKIFAVHMGAVGTDTNTYDLTRVEGIISGLETANNAIETAIRSYYSAAIAEKAETYTDAEYTTALSALALDSKTLTEIVGGFNINIASTTINVPAATDGSAVKAAYDLWYENTTAITTARTEYSKLTDKTQVSWSSEDTSVATVNSILISSGLVKIDNAKLNGYSADEVKTNTDAIFKSVVKDGIVVTLGDGAGVYSNIAEVAGDYTVDITFEQGTEVIYGGLSLDMGGMEGKMKADVAVNGDGPVVDIKASVPDAPANREGASSDAKLTDIYGYMLDFAFRTNASGSSLMLQTTPINRIYSDNTDTTSDTMGHGSTMTFTSLDTNFSTADVQNLMKAIRIVFTDKEGNILRVGVLTNFETIGQEVTGDVQLIEFTIDATTGVLTPTMNGTDYTYVKDSDTDTDINKTSIVALDKNQPEVVSVLVYLDGDKVQNKDVANATESMTGTLNLQFSSDATLKPMDYADLKGETGSDTPAGGESGGTGTDGN